MRNFVISIIIAVLAGVSIAYTQPQPFFDPSLVDHTVIQNIGVNSHPVVDTHLADGTIHFPAGSVDHGGLAGLADDDHTQYALLAGRAGGQSLIGGTAASDNLELSSTSNGTKGEVVVNEAGVDEDFRVEGDTDSNLLLVDAGTDNVGIGTGDMDGRLHVTDGNAGAVTARVQANTLVVEGDGGGNGSEGLSILTPDGVFGQIAWGSPSDDDYILIFARFVDKILNIGTNVTGGVIELRTDTFVVSTTFEADGTLTHERGAVFNELEGDFDFQVKGDTEPNLIATEASTDRVGIGTGDFDGRLHVTDGTAGAITADVSSNTLVVEGDGDGTFGIGLSILSPTTISGNILFGADGSNAYALIRAQSSTADLKIGTNTGGGIVEILSGGFTLATTFEADGTMMHERAAVFNELGGDNNFRVEGDTDPNLLLVDAGDDTVRVGGELVVGAPAGIKFSAQDNITVSSFAFANEEEVGVTFPQVVRNNFLLKGTDGVQSGAAIIEVGAEEQWTSGSSTRDGFLAIRTRTNNSATEKFRITSSGAVGINDSTPETRFDIDTSTTEATAVMKLDQNDADQAIIAYEGVSAANTLNSITTFTTGNSIQGFIRVEINGVTRWMPFYDFPTS